MFSIKENRKHPKIKKNRHMSALRNISFRYDSRIVRVLPAFVALVLIILLLGYYFYSKNYKNFNYLKIDKSQYLVYTIYSRDNDDNITTRVPTININNEVISSVNKKIVSLMNDFLKEEDNIATYEFEINGDILSLVLKMVDNHSSEIPEFKFRTYNFNLKTLQLVDDSELLQIYNIDEKTVSYKVQEQFKKFYTDEQKKGYIDSNQCDYACFLSWRDVDDYMDDIHYYIKEGKLYIYKEFVVYSIFGEEYYFKDKDFVFYIAG